MGLELTEDVIRENMPEYLPGGANSVNQVSSEISLAGFVVKFASFNGAPSCCLLVSNCLEGPGSSPLPSLP